MRLNLAVQATLCVGAMLAGLWWMVYLPLHCLGVHIPDVLMISVAAGGIGAIPIIYWDMLEEARR